MPEIIFKSSIFQKATEVKRQDIGKGTLEGRSIAFLYDTKEERSGYGISVHNGSYFTTGYWGLSKECAEECFEAIVANKGY